MIRPGELVNSTLDEEFDIDECCRAMQVYCCGDVGLLPKPFGCEGVSQGLLQLRSLASTRSFERLRVRVPALQHAMDRVPRGNCHPNRNWRGSTSVV
jgi:hypothetical protein